MNQVIRRNKNAGKQLVEYDLNIYIPEELDQSGDSYYDPASWRIHVYIYKDGDQNEWDDPIRLTADEIVDLGLNQDGRFDADSWYGLDGFRLDYWNKMSDRLKKYFDQLPKYWEDLAIGNCGDRLNY